MIRATVKSTEVETKNGTGKKSGKPYSIREQTAMLSFPSGEIRKHNLTLDDNAEPLPPGNYAPKESAVFIDGFDIKISSRARDWQAVR